MLRMRLRRMGTKKKPTYRVVVAEARSPRDGAFIDSIGHYNPRTEPTTIVINEERALHWLRNGVQPSDRVAKLLTIQGIMQQYKPASAPAAESAAPAVSTAKAADATAPAPPAAE